MIALKIGATWCQPCKQIAPALATTADRLPDLILMDVDVDDNAEPVLDLQVTGLPTVILLDDEGNEVDRATGAQNVTSLLAGL